MGGFQPNQGGFQGQGMYNQTPGYNQGYNPYSNLPHIQFNPNCRKCHGVGSAMSRKHVMMPCARCYRRAGYCRKCFGTGTNFRKNKPCKRCNKGRMNCNKSSSSSHSD